MRSPGREDRVEECQKSASTVGATQCTSRAPVSLQEFLPPLRGWNGWTKPSSA